MNCGSNANFVGPLDSTLHCNMKCTNTGVICAKFKETQVNLGSQCIFALQKNSSGSASKICFAKTIFSQELRPPAQQILKVEA